MAARSESAGPETRVPERKFHAAVVALRRTDGVLDAWVHRGARGTPVFVKALLPRANTRPVHWVRRQHDLLVGEAYQLPIGFVVQLHPEERR